MSSFNTPSSGNEKLNEKQNSQEGMRESFDEESQNKNYELIQAARKQSYEENMLKVDDLKAKLNNNENPVEENNRQLKREEAWKDVNTENFSKTDNEQNENVENTENNDEVGKFIDDIKINGDVIEFDSFEKIGDGGTHDVFMSDKSKDFVLKINRGAFEMIKEKNGKLSKEDKKLIDKFMEEKNKKNNKLYEYFGIGNCLYENMRLVKIKYGNNEFECPIVFQKNTDLFSNAAKVDFGTGYIDEVHNENLYKTLNDKLLTNKDVRDLSKKELNELVNLIPKSKDIFDKIKPGFAEKIKESFIRLIPKSKDIFGKITKPGFAEKVKEFLISFKAYYKSEGEIIDLVGKDNVLFYPEGDKWHFKLGSVVKNTTRDEVNNVLRLLNKNPEEFDKNSFDEKSLNHLKNLLACSRFLNCLGIQLGLGKIIELSLNDSQIENLNKMKI